MLLGEYIRDNPFTGNIDFFVWDAKRRRYSEGMNVSGNIEDYAMIRKYYDKKIRSVEIKDNRLRIEVFLGQEQSPVIPTIEMNNTAGGISMTKECLLEEVEEVIYEMIDDEGVECEYYEVQDKDSEEGMIAITGMRIVIPDLNVSVRTGDYCVYDPDEDDYMADFSVSLIYELDEKDPEKYLYWEQDGVMVSLYNYFHKDDISMDKLEQTKCTIEVEEA